MNPIIMIGDARFNSYRTLTRTTAVPARDSRGSNNTEPVDEVAEAQQARPVNPDEQEDFLDRRRPRHKPPKNSGRGQMVDFYV